MLKSLINPLIKFSICACLLPHLAYGFDVDGYMSCNVPLSKAIITSDDKAFSLIPSYATEGADARVQYRFGQGSLSVFLYLEEKPDTFLIVDSFIWRAKIRSGESLWVTDDSKFGKEQHNTSFARFSPDLIEIRPANLSKSLYLSRMNKGRWHGLVMVDPSKMINSNGVIAGFYALDCVDLTNNWSLALQLLENAESDN